MIKVLQINSQCNKGSTGKIAEGISKQIVNQGWESYIAFGRKSLPSKYSKEIKIGGVLDNYLHVLRTRLTDRHGFGSINATRELIKQIKELNVDIIHLHNIHGYYLNIELLFKFLKESKIPVVWTLHDCWSFTGHCAYYSYPSCEKWKSSCYNCPKLNFYPKSFNDGSDRNYKNKKNLFLGLDNLILVTPSLWLYNEIENSFLKGYSKKVINNGVNLDFFAPTYDEKIDEKYSLERKKTILGVASVWDERKGLDDFIKLRKILSKEFQIILVGLNNQQIKKLPKGIIGIKKTDSIKELSILYSYAHVFFNPTYEDNFPTTNLEALACGTPIITYRTGGSIESVENGLGYIVEQGDLENVKKILLSNKELYNKDNYEKKCREIAVNLYSEEDRFQEYIELYKYILSL